MIVHGAAFMNKRIAPLCLLVAGYLQNQYKDQIMEAISPTPRSPITPPSPFLFERFDSS